MATPYGHTLVGLSLLNLWYPKSPAARRPWFLYGLIVLGASLPDLDFIPGLILGQGGRFHHGLFHSLGLMIGISLMVTIVAGRTQGSPGFFKAGGLVFSLALSHLALDFFTQAPKGFPLFWPFTDSLFRSPVPIFPRVERNWGHPQLGHRLLLCFAVETFLLVPLWVTSWRRRPSANKA